jgi:hypothetical protein
VIERKGMIFTSDAKNFKHLRENERYDCPLCLMAVLYGEGWKRVKFKCMGRKMSVLLREAREGDKRLGNFNLILRES